MPYPPNLATLNKFDRIISTLLLLQTKRVIKATEIAAKFDISLRTVYRDIRTLETAGIPVIGEPGIGYSLVDGYRLPPVMFSQEEALSLLAAEKFIGKVTDETTEAHYVNAMNKIRAVLRGPEKDSLAVLDQAIVIEPQYQMQGKNFLTGLFQAISAHNVVFLQYKADSDAITERNIEPVGCYFHYNNWYLVGFCRLKNDYRNFKVNRILKMERLGEVFKSSHPNVDAYLATQAKAQETELVQVRFKKSVVKYAEGDKHSFGFIKSEQQGDEVLMTFLCGSVWGLSNWLLSFSDKVVIESPEHVVESMKNLAKRLAEQYSAWFLGHKFEEKFDRQKLPDKQLSHAPSSFVLYLKNDTRWQHKK